MVEGRLFETGAQAWLMLALDFSSPPRLDMTCWVCQLHQLAKGRPSTEGGVRHYLRACITEIRHLVGLLRYEECLPHIRWVHFGN